MTLCPPQSSSPRERAGYRWMRRCIASAVVTLLALMVGACEPQSIGFHLPEGDVDRGRATFSRLGCVECHSVAGAQGVAQGIPGGQPSDISVELGGPVSRVKTYGELVTAIIVPNHSFARGADPSTRRSDGRSRMRDYNETMTVRELADLSTFLQASYQIAHPQPANRTKPSR